MQPWAQPLGGRGSGPLNIFIYPQFWTILLTWGSVILHIEMFVYVFLEMSIISRFPLQLCIDQIERFKVCNFKQFLEGVHRPPSPDTPALSLVGSPSILAPPDSDPQLLKSGCALECSSVRKTNVQHMTY